jgi:KipI family sensor histidine kinase inhibitor
MTPDPVYAGDSALLLEIGDPLIDPDLNRRAIGIARTLRERSLPGVRDVVSTFRSVAVFFDPLSTDVARVAAALRDAADARRSSESGRTIDVPVVYGGEAGPDLTEVAAFARSTPQEVVERHAGRRYRVYMLGFLPGFPYMAHVDSTIAAPRHATPRLRVAAGSVAIAGAQTGIYPRESPGGWQLIGRTPLTLFDPAKTPPALFAPGDTVRFVPTDAPQTGEMPSMHETASRSSATFNRFVTVVRPGLLTTVQDSGRWGYQNLGVPVAGPMDHAAHRLANAMVGNPAYAAALEATIAGPELRVEQETRVAVAGGNLGATLDGAEVPLNAPIPCRKDSVLCFGARRTGTRAYIAFDGGVALDPVLGSQATHLVSGLGGISGRAIKAGDRLPLGEATGLVVKATTEASLPALLGGGGARVRVLPGPQAAYFDQSMLDALQRTRFTISSQSDRMGYRLSAPSSFVATPCQVSLPGSRDMISDVTFTGGLQIPPSGDPILLMADRQTTGGYPQIAVVITADLSVAGQLAPGDWIEFEVCRRTDAIAALIAAERKLLALR